MNNHHENLFFILGPTDGSNTGKDCLNLDGKTPNKLISCSIEKLKKKDELKDYKQFVNTNFQSMVQDDEDLKNWIKKFVVTKEDANQIGDALIEGTYYVHR